MGPKGRNIFVLKRHFSSNSTEPDPNISIPDLQSGPYKKKNPCGLFII